MEVTTQDKIVYSCAPCGCEHDGKHFDAPGICAACNMPLNPTYPGITLTNTPVGRKTAAILLYNGADIMDVTGPWSVFEHGGLNVVTVAKASDLIRLGMTMVVKPDYTFENLPEVDVIVIPGGGPAENNQDMEIVEWIKKRYESTETMFSVCSGAFFLGLAGLLDEQEATTFSSLIPVLDHQFPKAEVRNDTKYTDSGKIVTSAGLSSGIEAAFHVIAKYYGQGRAQDVANHMEYDWKPQSNYARTLLADNFLLSIRGLVNMFAIKYTDSQGNNEHWEYQYILTDQISPEKMIKLLDTEFAKMPDWTKLSSSKKSLSGYIQHPTIGKGKIELKIQSSKDGNIAILSAARQ